jgi:hypothetical protein
LVSGMWAVDEPPTSSFSYLSIRLWCKSLAKVVSIAFLSLWETFARLIDLLR